MIQNCRVHWSAQFLNTDHRLVVATLKLHLKSRRMVPVYDNNMCSKCRKTAKSGSMNRKQGKFALEASFMEMPEGDVSPFPSSVVG